MSTRVGAAKGRLPWRSVADIGRCWWMMAGQFKWMPFSTKDSIYSKMMRLHSDGDFSVVINGAWKRFGRGKQVRPTEIESKGLLGTWKVARVGEMVYLTDEDRQVTVDFRFRNSTWSRFVRLTPLPQSTPLMLGVRLEAGAVLFPSMKPKPCRVPLGKSWVVYFSAREFVYASDVDPRWIVFMGKRISEAVFDGSLWWEVTTPGPAVVAHPILFGEFQTSQKVNDQITVYRSGHIMIGSNDFGPWELIEMVVGDTVIERKRDGWIFVRDGMGKLEGGRFDGQIWRWGGRTRQRPPNGLSLRDCICVDPVFQPFFWVWRHAFRLVPSCVPNAVSTGIGAACQGLRISIGVVSLLVGVYLLGATVLAFLIGFFV